MIYLGTYQSRQLPSLRCVQSSFFEAERPSGTGAGDTAHGAKTYSPWSGTHYLRPLPANDAFDEQTRGAHQSFNSSMPVGPKLAVPFQPRLGRVEEQTPH